MSAISSEVVAIRDALTGKVENAHLQVVEAQIEETRALSVIFVEGASG